MNRCVTWITDITVIPTRPECLHVAEMLDLYLPAHRGAVDESAVEQRLVIDALKGRLFANLKRRLGEFTTVTRANNTAAPSIARG